MAIARRCSPLLQAAGVAVLLVVLTRPLLFGGYQRGADFWVHYWYVWHQSEAIRSGGPSLFLYDPKSMFVPRYAFYGGTLYAITGALGLLVGSVLRAYVATYLLGSAAAYGGWWWLGRQAGLGRLAAHAPALVFATAAYSITLLNPRSDWPEHIGISMMPLLAASALSVLRADRLRLLPALALMVSTVLFFGSHNLTLLCGTTLLAGVTALSLLCVPQARRLVTRRGVARVAGVMVPALLVDAWFLLPDLAYNSDTFVALFKSLWRKWLHQFGYLVATPRLVALGRDTSDAVSASFGVYALPVLAMAWTVIATAASRPRLRQPWLQMLLVLTAVTVAVIAVMTHPGLLVGPFGMLQYSFRLESYINLAISGAVLAALVLVKDQPALTRRLCHSALAAIVTVSVIQAAGQVDARRDASGSFDLTANPRYYAPKGQTHAQDYGAGASMPLADVSRLSSLRFSPDEVRAGSVSTEIVARAGQNRITNIVTVPQLVRVTGAHFVAGDKFGNMAIQIDRRPGPAGPVRITVSEADPPPVRYGRLLSILGLLGLAANLVAIGAGRRRRRRPAASARNAARPAPAERAGRRAVAVRGRQ